MSDFIKLKVNGVDWIVNVDSIVAVERVLNSVANVESIFVYLPNGVKLDVSRVNYDAILRATNPTVLEDSDRGYYQ